MRKGTHKDNIFIFNAMASGRSNVYHFRFLFTGVLFSTLPDPSRAFPFAIDINTGSYVNRLALNTPMGDRWVIQGGAYSVHLCIRGRRKEYCNGALEMRGWY